MADEISMHYDPMVSKLIVHGESREKCLQAMKTHLKKYVCLGVPNNIPFLIGCVEHPVFQRAGAINTGFLEEYADDMKLLAVHEFMTKCQREYNLPSSLAMIYPL